MNQKTIDEINTFYQTKDKTILGLNRASKIFNKAGVSCKHFQSVMDQNKNNKKTTTTNKDKIMEQKHQMRRKNIPLRSKKLTQSARGNPCTNCHLQDDTVVFAHAQCIDKGIGIKSPDFWGAFLCYRCHDELGDNIPLNAIYRTQRYWHQNGFIEVK